MQTTLDSLAETKFSMLFTLTVHLKKCEVRSEVANCYFIDWDLYFFISWDRFMFRI